MRSGVVAAAAAVLVVAGSPQQQSPTPPGVVRAGEYRAGAAAAGVTAQGSVYDVGPFPLSTPDLPPGEGRDATVAMCSVCHSLRYLTMQPPLPAEAWRATVRKMIDVHGAPIPEDAARQIAGYLEAHYGTSAR